MYSSTKNKWLGVKEPLGSWKSCELFVLNLVSKTN